MVTSETFVGVLSLQGDFAEHCSTLRHLNVAYKEVRTSEDLAHVHALILPGGESTVMMKLLKEEELDTAIIQRAQSGMPILGTCAGAILLSDTHLGLMDISIQRNAYGSQAESFYGEVSIDDIPSIEVAFIRAPKITRTGKSVSVRATYQDSPVFVQQDAMLATTFHTEVVHTTVLHEQLLLLSVKHPARAGCIQ